MINLLFRILQDSSIPKHPSFLFLWSSQATSTFGDRFTAIAIPILIYQITGAAWQLGLAFMLQVLATLLFGLWAGALSDRWNRKTIMISADLVRALFVLLIPLTLASNLDSQLKLITIYALNFLVVVGTQFYVPAKVSMIPQIVLKKELVAANTWDQGASRFMQAIGYSVAGILIASFDAQIAFIIDAGTFIVSALLVSQIKLPNSPQANNQQRSKKPSLVSSIREGIMHAWSIPLLQAVIVISIIVPAAVGVFQPLLLLFSTEVLGEGELGFGLLSSAMALGSTAGFFVSGRIIGERHRGYLLSIGTLFFGLFQLFGIIFPTIAQGFFERSQGVTLGGLEVNFTLLIVAMPFFFLTTLAESAISLGFRLIIQESTPNNLIGRVYSLIRVTTNGALAIGASTVGLADIFGVSRTMIGWSIYLIVAGVIALFHPKLRPPSQLPMMSADRSK